MAISAAAESRRNKYQLPCHWEDERLVDERTVHWFPAEKPVIVRKEAETAFFLVALLVRALNEHTTR